MLPKSTLILLFVISLLFIFGSAFLSVELEEEKPEGISALCEIERNEDGTWTSVADGPGTMSLYTVQTNEGLKVFTDCNHE